MIWFHQTHRIKMFLHYKFRPRPPKYFFNELILLYVCDLHPPAAANVPLFWSQHQSIGHNRPPCLSLVWKKKIWCTKRSKSSESDFCSACSGFAHYYCCHALAYFPVTWIRQTGCMLRVFVASLHYAAVISANKHDFTPRWHNFPPSEPPRHGRQEAEASHKELKHILKTRNLDETQRWWRDWQTHGCIRGSDCPSCFQRH